MHCHPSHPQGRRLCHGRGESSSRRAACRRGGNAGHVDYVPEGRTSSLERDRLPTDNLTHMQIQAHAITSMQPAAAVGQAVGAVRSTSVMDFARKLDSADLQQIQKTLGSMNHLYHRAGSWAVLVKYRDVYFAEKATPDSRSVIVALERGKQLLTELYHDGDRHPADTGLPTLRDRGNRLSPLSGQRRHCRRENTVKKRLISPNYHQRLSVARLHHSSGV